MKLVSLSDLSLKVWMGIVAILLVLGLFLTITLANIAPEAMVLSQLFATNTMSFNETIEATNMKAKVKEKPLIEEMLVRYYVENRNEYMPDKRELMYRWGAQGPVRMLSTPAVFRAFQAEKGNFIEALEGQNDAFAQKTLPITSVDITHLDRKDNTFIVDFNLYQNQDGIISSKGSRRAVIRIEPQNRSAVVFRDDFSNPYGMKVISYKETVLKK